MVWYLVFCDVHYVPKDHSTWTQLAPSSFVLSWLLMLWNPLHHWEYWSSKISSAHQVLSCVRIYILELFMYTETLFLASNFEIFLQKKVWISFTESILVSESRAFLVQDETRNININAEVNSRTLTASTGGLAGWAKLLSHCIRDIAASISIQK